jgi:hypothetical protein
MQKPQADSIAHNEKEPYVAGETIQDAGIGELREYQASPEEERRLLRKLDLL